MILYHGTVDDAAVRIMTNNHFIHSTGKTHLLGKGIYLYDDSDRAFSLAKFKTKYKNEKDSPILPYKPIVLKVNIQVDEEAFIDFDGLDPQNLFFQSRRIFGQTVREKGLISEVYTDSLFCDFLCRKLGVKMLAKTMVYQNDKEGRILTTTKNKNIDRNHTTHYRTEKHYCLKDNAWITNISYGRIGE